VLPCFVNPYDFVEFEVHNELVSGERGKNIRVTAFNVFGEFEVVPDPGSRRAPPWVTL
jgi:hypothetical protein